MKNIFIVLIVVIVGILGFSLIKSSKSQLEQTAAPNPQVESTGSDSKDDPSQQEVIAQELDTPWALTFLPGDEILVTERAGRVRLIKNGQLQSEPVGVITQSQESGEGGLLGIAADPDFSKNNYIYLYYTYSSSGDNTLNRVVRMSYKESKLSDEKTIVDQIPGASNHNGGRIRFGPDKALYITTGDAGNPSLSQDRNSLAGKILRVTDEGKAVPGNPFGNQIYSYGHRNPQGIAWDENGVLWSTEHGPSGGQFGTGRDEFNKIESGKNYGWPEIMGDETKSGMEQPVSHSGDDTWAPAGTVFYKYKDNEFSIFFAGLRGQALYEMNFKDGNSLLRTHFKSEFGRIREVILGPDNMLYITTSNLDGRGIPKSGDDKVIRINPQKL